MKKIAVSLLFTLAIPLWAQTLPSGVPEEDFACRHY